MIDPRQRFSTRVGHYARYRTGYPAGILDLMARECGLSRESAIADIGSGTGLLSELFFKNGNLVYCVEPNREMREAGEPLLREHQGFRSVAASAEETGLPAASVDFVVAGQAFHWFDHPRCKAEFARILRPAGWVVLIWNYRRTGTSAFLREYEDLSQTYVPQQGESFAPMMRELRALFDSHQSNGEVAFEYETRVYHGRLT